LVIANERQTAESLLQETRLLAKKSGILVANIRFYLLRALAALDAIYVLNVNDFLFFLLFFLLRLFLHWHSPSYQNRNEKCRQIRGIVYDMR